MSSDRQKNGEGSRWWRERRLVHELCDSWGESLSLPGTISDRVSIEIEPDAEPAPGTPWNWWISFSIGEAQFESIVDERLTSLLFEDDQGRFEDGVPVDRVVSYLRDRIVGLSR
jgi:hypothetical protein